MNQTSVRTVKVGPTGRRKAFTLIELLVVVAIIAILAGLLFPAVIAILKTSTRRKAATQATSIVHAVKAYRNIYTQWPGQKVQGGDGSIDQEDILADLLGNVRDKNFIEIAQGMLSVGQDKFIDPWGREYVIVMDENDDGNVDLNATEYETGINLSTQILHETVAVLSWGSNPGDARKRIYSWRQ